MSDDLPPNIEYRAVFASPYNDYIHYGAAVSEPSKLPKSAPRSEETHEYVSGIQIRRVTDWSETITMEVIKTWDSSKPLT